MDFVISSKTIREGKTVILYDGGALPGVKRIVGKVASDIGAVFGSAPKALALEDLSSDEVATIEYPILVGTVCATGAAGAPGAGAAKKAGKKPAGACNILTKLEAAGLLSLGDVAGKREVYLHKVIGKLPEEELFEGKQAAKKGAAKAAGAGAFPTWKSAFVIAGSDKRGTIYGLFALSEKLGVSPFIDWLDVMPEKKSSFTIPGKYKFTSKEPSVRFRGFFINDEWPAFGTWCNKRFGGFNAKCYEHVFELLLRLKGNYLWPAMWSAIFPNDGPGLANCELADEMGVVMGMSHHEPCLRQGEEYRYLRGPKSVYGDAWNFLTNEKGITKFWEDGLARSGRFENVVTVGMRGEADTAIMGKDATLADNINLLRKVLKTQNRLIKKYVNKNLDEVPRMLALYKEVEPYFYGDEKTPGLMGDPELDGVTLMLCDDNFGNLRTVPTPKMRDHKGGYGMYYHFDYHGFPISYEWFNITHLAKVWEQMTYAYDSGIRDLWIVNVGDIFSNEYPLSFFLDLGYDFERWGTSNKNAAAEYTKLFVEKYFGGTLSSSQKRKVVELLLGYTRITHARRTEAMNDDVYAPFAYGECEEMLAKVDKLMKDTVNLYGSISEAGAVLAKAAAVSKTAGTGATLVGKLLENVEYRFYELVYLPLMANLNVQRMWLLTTLNHAYAKMGSTYAMDLAEEIHTCLEFDREMVDELHRIHGGMWYGMGLSEHIGFKNWCEEECQYPVVHTFLPGNKDRLIVTVPVTGEYTEGYFWTRREVTLPDFLDPRENTAHLDLTTGCDKKISFTVECDAKYITVTPASGVVNPRSKKSITVRIDRSKMPKMGAAAKGGKGAAKAAAAEGAASKAVAGDGKTEAKIIVRFGEGAFAEVRVPVNTEKALATGGAGKPFVWCGDVMNYISINAENYSSKTAGTKGVFERIPDYSRGLAAMKAYPQDVTFRKTGEAPTLSYNVVVPKAGKYVLRLLTNPGNPDTRVPELFVGVSANGGKMKKVNMILPGFAVGDGNDIWMKSVLDNMRTTEVELDLNEGANTIGITAVSPNTAITRLVLFEKNNAPMDSYNGPRETYREV